MKKFFWIIFIYCIFCLTSCNHDPQIQFDKSGESAETSAYESVTEMVSASESEEYINVFISGSVKKPDVYSVKRGAIVNDVLLMAGGFEEDACRDYVNLAKRVEDGEHIVIPNIEEMESSVFSESESAGKSSLININTATKEELMNLPGIGERKAESIIEYRSSNSFLAIEDIMNIPGIKESAFNKIKDKICIN